jgi:hypothetical protein
MAILEKRSLDLKDLDSEVDELQKGISDSKKK